MRNHGRVHLMNGRVFFVTLEDYAGIRETLIGDAPIITPREEFVKCSNPFDGSDTIIRWDQIVGIDLMTERGVEGIAENQSEINEIFDEQEGPEWESGGYGY